MDMQQFAPLTACLTKATVAAGTTTTITNTGTITYAVKGKLYTKTAMTNVATPTTDFATGKAFKPIPIPLTTDNPGPGYGSVFMIGLDKAGTLRVIQGSIEVTDGTNFLLGPQFGALGPQGVSANDNDFCPIAYLLVSLGSTAVASWLFGTNNLSGVTGATYVFQDVATEPDRPQTS